MEHRIDNLLRAVESLAESHARPQAPEEPGGK